MSELSLTIIFDETWLPTAILSNGQTDQETARLLEIADKMLVAIKEREQ